MQIHQYMLSKTPSPKPNPEECNKTSSADSDDQSQTKPQDTEAATAEPVTAVEENVVDQIAEEAGQTVVPGANAGENVAAGDNRNGLVRQREQATVAVRAAQRRGDDRLFTWAAVGLTIAIVVLLLKKLVRSSGHGALFMDES